jgi:branched-subunit amino acid transport protein AzlD
MPFEPLDTDEKIEAGYPRRKRDLETQLLGGCMVVLVGSLITYALVIWPWFTFKEYEISGLEKMAVFGGVPASIFGVVVIRKLDAAGLAAFMGGAMAAGVFVFLRLQQSNLGRYAQDLPMPEFPERWVMLVPLGWLAWIILVALASYPRRAEQPSS